MKTRPSTRLLIIDPDDRILLFRTENSPLDPATAFPAYWYVPGGGVEEDETFEDAGRRELWEEVGIQGVEIGPRVWYREQLLRFPDSGEALSQEHYFPVRVEHVKLNFVNMGGYEAAALSHHYWWPIDELRATPDIVFPEELADHLPPVLAGEYPLEPLRIR